MITFIGLSATANGVSDGNNTSRFSFVDGSNEGRDFFSQAEVHPWGITEPDDTDNNENCILDF